MISQFLLIARISRVRAGCAKIDLLSVPYAALDELQGTSPNGIVRDRQET
jgi:hypothetical protein